MLYNRIISYCTDIGSIGKGTVVALIGAIPSLFAILKKSKKENIKFKI